MIKRNVKRQLSLPFSLADFIQADAEHIRGTECDQKILSKRESHGQVFSPNYPFPYQTNVVCRYECEQIGSIFDKKYES